MDPTPIDPAAPFTVAMLRAELGLTQEAFGARIGLANKASVSLLESGRRDQCSLRVALAIEELSAKDGEPRIDAADLNDDVRASRQGVTGGGGAVHGDPNSPAALAPATGQIGDLSGPLGEAAPSILRQAQHSGRTEVVV